MGLAIDLHQRLFVASPNNSRVEVFGLDDFSDPRVVPALVEIRPRTLRAPNRCRFIYAYLELPGVPLEAVQTSSVTANGVPAEARPVAIGDHDHDGIPDLKLAFDARAVLATLSGGDVVVVSGALADGTPFEGSAAVRVVTRRRDGERRGDDERAADDERGGDDE
jgi:hypothetical protein